MNQLTEYQTAALTYNRHISLTANAGSGKTTVLSKRYLEILLNEDVTINNIVAITFTEKAASELYSKIASEIELKIIDSSGKLKNRLENIRRSLVSANISTIHSFCIDILKDFAPEAGIDANFIPIDARSADELLEHSIEEAISNNLNNNSNSVKRLIRIFGNRIQLVNNVKQLFSKRKSTEYLISKYYKNHSNNVSDWLGNNFQQLLNELFAPVIDKIIYNLHEVDKIAWDKNPKEKYVEISYLINELSSKQTYPEKVIYLNKIKEQLLTQKGTVVKRGYLSTKAYAENEVLLEEISDLFNEIGFLEIYDDYHLLNEELADFGVEVTNLYEDVNDRYSNIKHSKSYLDFEDLLLISQKLLLNNNVKNALGRKFKYIMIDEYQDTNETQYNIFMPILDNLKTGNLFIVGDEKQSIYMFREAEVELFNRTKTEIHKSHKLSGVLELPHSFRLSPNIALFTNLLFRQLFTSVDSKLNDVNYSELVCAYQGSDEGKIDLLIADQDEIPEAELVARKIHELVKSDKNEYKYSDITILCTKRKNFAELENAFSEFNIPYNIVGGKGFFQQQLVLDIYNYISFLLNPENDLALASILRSPFYGFSDMELTKITFLDGPNLFEKLKKTEEFNVTVLMLTKHLESAKVFRPNELIRKITRETAYWTYISSKKNGQQELANLNKLIQKSIDLDNQGFNTLFDITLYLNDAINKLEDEGHAELESSSNSVKIMTIHQSKGLEFKVVVIYKMNQKRYDESLKSKDIVVDKNFGLLAKLPSKNDFFSEYRQAPIVGMYNYVQNKKSEAELKRLLYVAVTRAELHLILSLSTRNGNLVKGSFAQMAIDALAINLESNKIELDDELTFMSLIEKNYVSEKRNIQCSIQVQKEIEINLEEFQGEPNPLDLSYNIFNTPISNFEKNEIISASKISLFLNCPKKYELTYEFGYGELTKFFSDQVELEFNSNEETIAIPSNIVGSVAHSILEKNIDKNELKSEIEKLLSGEDEIININIEKKNKIIDEVFNLIRNYYLSDHYKNLNQSKRYLNEAEFYKLENDYYLYGIIDKLIITDEKIIIVDYKTDKVNSENFSEKRDTYLNQLSFYAYLLLNQYKNIMLFELSIIFLREPNLSTYKQLRRQDIEKFGNIIRSSVNKIRNKQFDEEAEGCKNMKYYLLSEN